MDKKSLWESTLAELQINLSEANFMTWFKGKTAIVSWEDGLVSIGCNSPYVKSWIESRYQNQIKVILEKVTGVNLNLMFTVDPQIKEPAEKRGIKKLKLAKVPTTPLFIEEDRDSFEAALSRARLNPSFSFAGFVVGKSNQLAYAIAKALTEGTSKNYNPFFLYGGVGLGKTHIIQAIGQEALVKNPSLKVVYCTCEEFTNELITAIQTKTTSGLRKKYRTADILIVDDVQFLSGRESTQEEIFHTFNFLATTGKQIVLSSDRPPSAINKLTERLKSRFEGGIIADIGLPDLELREAILAKKCVSQGVVLPNEISHLLAEKFTKSIRDLEGGLIRLITYAKLTNRKISTEVVKEVVEVTLKQNATETTPAAVINTAAKYFSLTPTDIKGSSRRTEVVRSRQIAMYILRKDLGLPLAKIAQLMNKSDHTSVMYSVNKVSNEAGSSGPTCEIIEKLRERIFT